MSRFIVFILKVNKGHLKLVNVNYIKNSQISLYFHFNKLIKGPGTTFKSPALSQKHVRNICHTANQYLTEFHFDSTQDSGEISISVNFHYGAMSMMTSQILKSVDFTETQKSRYLENETFFKYKNSLITHQGLLCCKKQFCSGANLFKFLKKQANF